MTTNWTEGPLPRVVKKPTDMTSMRRLSKPRDTNEVDRLIGSSLLEIRVKKGVTQAQLADAVGISSQQLQRYEAGKSRVAASRLFELCQAMGIPIAWIFEDIESAEITPNRRP